YGEGAISDWGALHLREDLAAAAGLAAAGYASFALAEAAGRLAGSWLLARFGQTRVLVYGGLLTFAGMLAPARSPVLPLAPARFAPPRPGLAHRIPPRHAPGRPAGRPERRAPGVPPRLRRLPARPAGHRLPGLRPEPARRADHGLPARRPSDRPRPRRVRGI